MKFILKISLLIFILSSCRENNSPNLTTSATWKSVSIYFPMPRPEASENSPAINALEVELVNPTNNSIEIPIREKITSEKTFFYLLNSKNDTIRLSSREEEIQNLTSNSIKIVHLSINDIAFTSKNDYERNIRDIAMEYKLRYSGEAKLTTKTENNVKIAILDNYVYPRPTLDIDSASR